MTYYTNNLYLPHMSFLLIHTKDISDSFYNAQVEILETKDDSFLVKHLGTKEQLRFSKENDPRVDSFEFIENPFMKEDAEDILTYLNREEEDQVGTGAASTLAMEERFGGYSKLTREQSILLLQQTFSHPKELAVLGSLSPDMPLESISSDAVLRFYPNPIERSRLFVPVVNALPNIVADEEEMQKKSVLDSAQVDLIRDTYSKYAPKLEQDGSEHPISIYGSTPYKIQDNPHVQFYPSTPVLLYDTRQAGATTYQKMRIKTCMREDISSRSTIYDDVKVPIFTPSVPISLIHSPLSTSKVTRMFKKAITHHWSPLLSTAYSYTQVPHIDRRALGLQHVNIAEEYVRHYISPTSLPKTPHHNTWDQYYETLLMNGIDLHYNPHDIKKSYNPTFIPSQMLNGYVPMSYVPEPVVLSKQEMKVVDWAEQKFPKFKSLVDSYRNTKTPQLWYEFMFTLKELNDVNPATVKEDLLAEVRSLLSLSQTASLQTIQDTIRERHDFIRREHLKASQNDSLCYGLSIRKVYDSLEDFKEEIKQEEELYWDPDRDPFSRDHAHILEKQPSLLQAPESSILAFLQNEIPFLSNYELKRRAFEQVQSREDTHRGKTPIRKGDLIMIRLINATYIYQKTEDGWSPRKQGFQEEEYCNSKSKGYISLKKEQLTRKDTLEDGCTFIDKTCVPNSVKKWIELLEAVDHVETMLAKAMAIEETIQQRKTKLEFTLERLVHIQSQFTADTQKSITDDSWVQAISNDAIDKETQKHLMGVKDLYEEARKIPDFVKSWLQVEQILDTHTRFDVGQRSYVEITTRVPIACEHVSFCIMAARSNKPGSLMKQMISEFGNQDEVGQRSVCKLCGEEIGDIVVSEMEGYGQGEAPIQVREVTEVALQDDYLDLPRPAQILYKMVVQLRDSVGFQLPETDISRSVKTWYQKFLIASKTNHTQEFLLSLHLATKSIRGKIITQVTKKRKLDFFKKNPRLLRQKNSKELKLRKQQEYLMNTNRFVSSAFALYEKMKQGLLTESETKTIENYKTYVNASLSTSQLNELTASKNEIMNVVHSALILVFAIQTSQTLTKKNIVSLPGIAQMPSNILYLDDPSILIQFILYVYAKRTRIQEKRKKNILKLLSFYQETTLQEESVKAVRSDALDRLRTLERESIQELEEKDRIFTPNRNPFAASFRTSFPEEHPIQTTIRNYEELQGIEVDPNSINPNTWMDYIIENKESSSHTKSFKRISNIIDVAFTRFPLSTPRLESMMEEKDVKTVKKDILSFCSYYDDQTGKPRRKIQLQVVGMNETNAEFMDQVQKRIPPVLLDGNEEFIRSWIESYQKETVVEYDLDADELISNRLKEKEKEIEKYSDVELLQERERIRILVGQGNKKDVDQVEKPTLKRLPRIISSSLPEWYQESMKRIESSVVTDRKSLANFLTQANIRDEQQSWTLDGLQSNTKEMYKLEYVRLVTNIWYDVFKKKRSDMKDTVGDDNLKSVDDILEVKRKRYLEGEEWESTIQFIVDQSSITEGVITEHNAEVLANQNMERKKRADRFTEEESGLQKLYREFQLGGQFQSIDEMGIESEAPVQQYGDAQGIDIEEALALAMGLGENEGQMDPEEYDVL